MTLFPFVPMSSISKASRVVCAPLSLEHGLLAGIALVLMSATISTDMLEILAGLLGTLVVCVMKKRGSRKRACVAEPIITTPAHKCAGATPGTKSGRKISEVKTQQIRPVRSPLRKAEPKTPLTFASHTTLHEQVDQLLHNVMPTGEDLKVCEELAHHLVPPITKLIPEAKVNIVAHNSILRVGQTGLRPEVDLIVTVAPDVLVQRLLMHMRDHPEDRSVRKFPKIAEVEEATLNKFAIRAVAAQLAFCPLWRTAYRGTEPKVVLLAPRSLGIVSEDIHVHIAVNSPNTVRAKDVYNQSESQVQKLITLVRRWAQDRCIANTAYGHMPLYGWSLFATYFCQSHVETCTKSAIEMFGAFVDFCLDWHDSERHAGTETGLQLADPYDSKRNVAESITPLGMQRFREELERAKKLVENGSSLVQILEHCNPPPPNSKDGSLTAQRGSEDHYSYS